MLKPSIKQLLKTVVEPIVVETQEELKEAIEGLKIPFWIYLMSTIGFTYPLLVFIVNGDILMSFLFSILWGLSIFRVGYAIYWFYTLPRRYKHVPTEDEVSTQKANR